MATAVGIDAAVDALRRGGLVAFPTETVYGLGCDATNDQALARLYAVKGRPVEHPVIVHVPGADALDDWAVDVPPEARILAGACWPGPLTLVLRRATRVPDAVTGGRDTVGLRVPDQPVAAALLHAFDGGIAAPSANRFGRVSPTTADDVRADLDGEVDVVLDGGACTVGVESTIVDCTTVPPAILRLGGIPRALVEELIGSSVALRTSGETASPGTMAAHYAPDARVIVVDAGDVAARATGFLAGGDRVGLLSVQPVPRDLPEGLVVLDSPVDADDYARMLYSQLRDADRRGLDVVLAVAPTTEGIGAAVLDRLTRASAS
ncbi:MAG: L-threonylcarbamoyladenylate synthase [Acidimicrobiia bacterium]